MEAAFLRGTGNTLAMSTLQIGIAAIVAGFLMVWLVWVIIGQYQLWVIDREKIGEMLVNCIKAVVFVSILIVVLIVS